MFEAVRVPTSWECLLPWRTDGLVARPTKMHSQMQMVPALLPGRVVGLSRAMWMGRALLVVMSMVELLLWPVRRWCPSRLHSRQFEP